MTDDDLDALNVTLSAHYDPDAAQDAVTVLLEYKARKGSFPDDPQAYARSVAWRSYHNDPRCPRSMGKVVTREVDSLPDWDRRLGTPATQDATLQSREQLDRLPADLVLHHLGVTTLTRSQRVMLLSRPEVAAVRALRQTRRSRLGRQAAKAKLQHAPALPVLGGS